MDINVSYFRLALNDEVLGISISNSDIGPHIHHHTYNHKGVFSVGKHPHLLVENIQYIKRWT